MILDDPCSCPGNAQQRFHKASSTKLAMALGSLPHIGTVSGSVSDTMSQWVYCPMIFHGKYGSGFMSAMDTQGASSF